MRNVYPWVQMRWVLVNSIKGHKLRYPLTVQISRLPQAKEGWLADVQHIGIYSSARGKTIRQSVKLAVSDLIKSYNDYRRHGANDKDPEFRAQVKLFLAVMKKRL